MAAVTDSGDTIDHHFGMARCVGVMAADASTHLDRRVDRRLGQDCVDSIMALSAKLVDIGRDQLRLATLAQAFVA